ncbi:MAG: hypothetical protein P8Y14_26435, partial [Anaerolineales bacterium]
PGALLTVPWAAAFVWSRSARVWIANLELRVADAGRVLPPGRKVAKEQISEDFEPRRSKP